MQALTTVCVWMESVSLAVVVSADEPFLAVRVYVTVTLVLAAEVGRGAAAPALGLAGRVALWVQHACRQEC